MAEQERYTKETKLGKDLAVGDVYYTWGKGAITITGFREHPGLDQPNGKKLTARVLLSGDYAITTFDNDMFWKTSDGCWICPTHWFNHEQKLKDKRVLQW